MVQIASNCWVVGDAPVLIPAEAVGTVWEKVLSTYNKIHGKSTGTFGVFTLKDNHIYARVMPKEGFKTSPNFYSQLCEIDFEHLKPNFFYVDFGLT